MKKLLLTLLTTLMLTGPAWAEWVKVTESDTIYRYIDPATIRKDGNLVRVWEITDLKTRHKDGELSRRSRMEYDCKQERAKYLSISEHSEAMASGTILNQPQIGLGQWFDIPPGSVVEAVLKIVCAK
jgi:hypothetical protein